MKIEINLSEAEKACEHCLYAEGGSVYVDGELILKRVPIACENDYRSFGEDDLLVMALERMGWRVLVGSLPHPFPRTPWLAVHGEHQLRENERAESSSAFLKGKGSVVVVEMQSDNHVCDTCGSSYAEAGWVSIDGKLILERKPSAHCTGSTNFSSVDLLVMALTKLGHEILVDGERFPIACADEEYHGA